MMLQKLYIITVVLFSVIPPNHVIAQTAPNVIYKVVWKKNGVTQGSQIPVSTFSDSVTSGPTTYSWGGNLDSQNDQILYATNSNTVYNYAGSLSPTQELIVTVYVKGMPTASVNIESVADVKAKSFGTPRAESWVSYPLQNGIVDVVKPQGVTGTFTNYDEDSNPLFRALSCTSDATYESCKTFTEYPGVTYCIPEYADEIKISGGTINTGNWQSWVDLKAIGGLSITVEIGDTTPTALINGPFAGGVPVTSVSNGTPVTMYNDSYDEDENKSTTPREGICSASWEVVAPDTSIVATGSNIYSIIFTPTQVGTYRVNLAVIDNEGITSSTYDEFAVY